MVRRHVASICAIPLIKNLTFWKIVFWQQIGRGEVGRAVRRHPGGGTQEAPRRLPGGTQEAPRGTQGTQEAPRGLGCRKWATSLLKHKSYIKMLILLCVFEGRCHQSMLFAMKMMGRRNDAARKTPRPLSKTVRTPTVEDCLGNDDLRWTNGKWKMIEPY